LFEASSASLAQPRELALQGGEAIDEVEDHGDAVEVDAKVSAQAGDRNQTREAGGVKAHLCTRPLRGLDQAELDESLDQDRVQPNSRGGGLESQMFPGHTPGHEGIADADHP
jgi:hypothetical protein